MKILIVSAVFNPPTISPRGFRTTELVKEFSRRGDNVTVLLPKIDFDYSGFLVQYPNVEFKFLKISNNDIKSSSNKVVNFFKKAISKILYRTLFFPYTKLYIGIPQVLNSETKFDLLISVANPHSVHWGVNAAIEKCPSLTQVWIADCGDPFIFNPVFNKHIPFYLKFLEKKFCRRADFITVPTSESISGYYPEFRDKIRVIPQGFDFKEIELGDYSPNRVITFAYSGLFIDKIRDPRPVLEQIKKLKKDFKFIIYTKTPELVNQYKTELGDKIEIYPYIPRLELLKKLSCMDFVLNIENSGISVQTPSKLIDYYLISRPILSINCQNIDVENLTKFMNGDFSGAYNIENAEEYNIVNVCNKFYKLYQERNLRCK